MAFEDASEIRCLGVILCTNEEGIFRFKLQNIRECYSFLSEDISTLPRGWQYTGLTVNSVVILVLMNYTALTHFSTETRANVRAVGLNS